ncbi:beta-phosphoglucomutase-like phosphatase (HAD superfamily) [Paenibacillus shirakamiensis]|uniref:Beta-phosphoglucomutase-like phosphatase (HAD superfamily) n=1 Tax=Paenibacillus shirakamiensis TaxID=1265935 RepID=A0ABS4JHT9_9BACL|nr:beta-phosphoglucomutase-like phosphatase (HAD superfamily) [Paenibacillus shirakamiensis]
MKPFLVFDFDGTMVQSKSLAIQLFNEPYQVWGESMELI